MTLDPVCALWYTRSTRPSIWPPAPGVLEDSSRRQVSHACSSDRCSQSLSDSICLGTYLHSDCGVSSPGQVRWEVGGVSLTSEPGGDLAHLAHEPPGSGYGVVGEVLVEGEGLVVDRVHHHEAGCRSF